MQSSNVGPSGGDNGRENSIQALTKMANCVNASRRTENSR